MYTQLYLTELEKGAGIIKNLLCNLANKNIVITGASGVIGKELVDLLLMCNKLYNTNIGVYAVGRDEKKLQNAFDNFITPELHLINYEDMFKMPEQVHYIVHLASITSSKMFVEYPVNVLEESFCLTKKILDFAVQKNVQMFNYVSSVEVYGKPYSNQKILTEDMHGELLTTNIRNSYPEAKRFCESLTTAYAKQYNLNVTISRPVKVFSMVINRNDKRVFNDFAQKVANKENIVLKSDGKQVFTYCYGLDVVCGLLYVLLKGESGEAYNIGSDKAVASITNVANEFAHQGGVQVEYQIEDNSKTGYVNVGHWVVDIAKLKKLGYEPQYDLIEGIKSIILQYKNLINN